MSWRWQRRIVLCVECDHGFTDVVLLSLVGPSDPFSTSSALYIPQAAYRGCVRFSRYASRSRQPADVLIVSVARRKKRSASLLRAIASSTGGTLLARSINSSS